MNWSVTGSIRSGPDCPRSAASSSLRFARDRATIGGDGFPDITGSHLAGTEFLARLHLLNTALPQSPAAQWGMDAQPSAAQMELHPPDCPCSPVSSSLPGSPGVVRNSLR